MSAPRKQVNGRPKGTPPIPEPKKILFQSDLPIEQAAYEGTVKALGYEPILHPYIDEEHQAVSTKFTRAMESLRELSRE